MSQLPRYPGFAKIMAGAAYLREHFTDLDVDHDIPDGIGFNRAGTIRYIDKDLFNAIMSGQADTGLTPEQTIECLVEEIEAEASIAAHDNGVDHSADIALLAYQAAAEKVEALGGDADKYERALVDRI